MRLKMRFGRNSLICETLEKFKKNSSNMTDVHKSSLNEISV